jgi:hypothetical protein
VQKDNYSAEPLELQMEQNLAAKLVARTVDQKADDLAAMTE